MAHRRPHSGRGAPHRRGWLEYGLLILLIAVLTLVVLLTYLPALARLP